MCLLTILNGHTSKVNSVEFANSEPILCSGSEDYSIKLWSTIDYKCLKNLIGHKDGVCSVSFSSNDIFIVSGSHDK